MSEASGGRRERRKAQTRAEVRDTAQRLFAERGFDAVTIADVAAAAEVAVQTVFNHFETKEALFFDGRTPWVEQVLAAVTQRAPGADPVAALHAFIAGDIVALVELESRPENRGYLEALAQSPSLRSRERTLVEQTAERVAAALCDAITTGDWPPAATADRTTAHVLSRLIAHLFLVAGRVLVLENRRMVLAPDPGETRRSAARTTAAALAALEHGMRGLADRLVDQPV